MIPLLRHMRHIAFDVTVFSLLLHAPATLLAQEQRDVSPGIFAAERHFALGKDAYEHRDYEKAQAHLDAAIHRRKNYPEALFFRALTKEHLHDTLGALTDYNALIYFEPDHAEALYSRGTLRYALGQYSYAIMDFQAALRLPVRETHTVYYKTLPQEGGTIGVGTLSTMQPEILNYIGLCYLGEKQYAKAIAHYDSVQAHAEVDVDMMLNRGKAREAIGDLQGAAADYRAALDMDPGNQAARLSLSTVYSASGETGKAIEVLDAMITGHSASVHTLTQRGLYHFEEGNFAQALSDFDSAIMISVPDPELYYNRGLALMKMGETDRAIADFGRSLQTDDRYAKAYQARGAALIRKKAYHQALNDLDRAIHHEPDYGIAYYNRAVARLYLRMHDTACEDLRQALRFGVAEAARLMADVCTAATDQQESPR